MEFNQGADEAERGQPTTTPQEPEENIPCSRSCFDRWRVWIRPAALLVYGGIVVATAPEIILDAVRNATGQERLRVILACVAYFAMAISIAISVWSISNHAVCFTRPALQKYIIGILLVVPLYELSSWFSLRFPVIAVYWGTLRQLCQAFAIFCYILYVLTFFEEVPNFDNRLVMKPQIIAPPPCCCITVVPNQRFIKRSKVGVLGYAVVRIVFAIVTLITDLTGTFHEGNFSPKNAYLWVTIIVTTAQLCTIFCLLLLRKTTYDELQMLPKSTAQLVCVLMVVFVTDFQSIFLSFLAQVGAINPTAQWGFDGDEYALATMLQNLLVCLELILAAIAFSLSFDYQRYNTGTEPILGILQSLKKMRNSKSSVRNHVRDGGAPSESTVAGRIPSPSVPPPASLEASTASSEDANTTARKRKTGHQFIAMPDIISNHHHNADNIVELHSPGGQDGENLDGSDQNQEDECQDVGPENKAISQGQSVQKKPKPDEEEFRDDASEDTDDFLDDFPTDDDDDDSDGNGLPIDPRLDAPRAVPQRRRVKKVSYAGMTFDDLDVNTLESPRNKNLDAAKRRVKKVSYAGMTFDDMDWDHIKSHRSPTMDSEMAGAVTSIVEQNEEKHKETEGENKDGEGFGSSEA